MERWVFSCAEAEREDGTLPDAIRVDDIAFAVQHALDENAAGAGLILAVAETCADADAQGDEAGRQRARASRSMEGTPPTPPPRAMTPPAVQSPASRARAASGADARGHKASAVSGATAAAENKIAKPIIAAGLKAVRIVATHIPAIASVMVIRVTARRRLVVAAVSRTL